MLTSFVEFDKNSNIFVFERWLSGKRYFYTLHYNKLWRGYIKFVIPCETFLLFIWDPIKYIYSGSLSDSKSI